ncbi:uncharacterized protein LOC126905859 [Daktulosphaira vitifoliae]|uniref:uncharacterized protein LOC126905859 n=1 Tax=Daktulosphaira vitifoliae TaxID=58002 RepID=UPI0021AB0A27|nr:uncharacterized protein LOC126905859 [Daktulosphaira vitifoliae]
MKAALVIASLFVTIVALDATFVRKFPGDHNQRQDVYKYGSDSEFMQTPKSEFFENDDIESNYYYKKFNQMNNYENGWSFESEEVGSNEESSEQYKHNNNVEVFQPGTASRGVVEKIAAIDRIIAKEQQLNYNVGVNDLKTPLNVRNVYIKNPQREVITLKNAQIKNIENGHLKYLVIDSERDALFVQYNFDQLRTEGFFKIDSTVDGQHGDFAVELHKVRSNVTEKLSTGKTFYRPSKFEYADVVATNQHGYEVEALYEPFNYKYFTVLEETVADEVHNSIHKGLLFKLKNEINTPMNNIKTGQYSKLFDLKWQEKLNALEMNNIGSKNWQHGDRQINSFSYTRLDSKTYQLRYNTVLKNIQWTSDLKTMLSGEQQAFYKSSNFKVDKVRINVTILKNINNHQCNKVNVNVHLDGFNYLPVGQVQNSNLPSFTSHQLPRFMEHNFEAAMEKSLEQELCFGQTF